MFELGRVMLTLGVVSLLIGCQTSGGEGKTEVRGGAFATVGASQLSTKLLVEDEAIARKSEADDLVYDALFATEARNMSPGFARAIERGVLVRALFESMRAESLGSARPSPSEVEELKQQSWENFARPPAVRTLLIAVEVGELGRDDDALALAEELRRVALEAPERGELERRVRKAAGEEVIGVTELPPVADGGRIVPFEPSDRRWKEMEPRLASQITSLSRVGEFSEIFAEDYGYAFLYVLETYPPLDTTQPDVAERLHYAVAARRLAGPLRDIKDAGSASVQRSKKELGAILGLVWRDK